MPDLFPTTEEAAQDQARGIGIVNHIGPDSFKPDGLRPFFEYRKLGIEELTHGKVGAHVIRAKPGLHADAPRHTHTLDFQFVYVLKGWAIFDYEGYGEHKLVEGSTVYQPPGIRHGRDRPLRRFRGTGDHLAGGVRDQDGGMIAYPRLADQPTAPFSGDDVVNGVVAGVSDVDGPGRVRVTVDGTADTLAFYGTCPAGSRADPVIFQRGDAFEGKAANQWYVATSAHDVQALAEQFAATFGRPYLHLGRPGILGSTGNHLDRRRPREVALVDAALDRLKRHFGWTSLNLAGQSGGGHLVAALMARRSDIDCAVIASGNTAVAQRNRENGWATDITWPCRFPRRSDRLRG